MGAFHGVWLVILAALCGVATTDVQAQQPNKLQQSETVWKAMDNCKRQAWRQHPDYTREGNAKREEAMKLCLRASSAPPIAPPTPRESSGSSQR
jgi:hypothetical protein